MKRIDGRQTDELRPIRITKGIQKDPHGSILIEWGDTKVICSVTVEEKVPPWLQNQNKGWITAEYNMLPGSSDQRIHRDKARSNGRTQEIQRLIGRSLRAAVELNQLGSRTFLFDCDVIQADGGTRVASITGSYLAFCLALEKLHRQGKLKKIPETKMIAAISIGKLHQSILCDLNYHEDVQADLDANVVMNDSGEFIELQGTAEKGSFTLQEWNALLEVAQGACQKIFQIQKDTLEAWRAESS
jgi:ribonuclease PH